MTNNKSTDIPRRILHEQVGSKHISRVAGVAVAATPCSLQLACSDAKCNPADVCMRSAPYPCKKGSTGGRGGISHKVRDPLYYGLRSVSREFFELKSWF